MLIESLKRLYPNQVTLDKLKVMVIEEKISKEEYFQITNLEYSLGE